ncbi:MAG: gamma carbonic anhydrase family protein [Nitrospirae bacterium]|nr:MAG: gamma carbonic anhydrase family protein [Nitrospirota bacterium]
MSHVYPYGGLRPRLHPSVFLAPTAVVAGDVVMGEGCSVWFNATVRGDVNFVRIGARVNVQDHAMIHVTHDTHPVVVEDDCSIAHGALLHGCTLRRGCLVGIGAIVLDGAEVPEGALVAAGSLVPPGKVYPPHTLILGRPARAVRPLTEAERARVAETVPNYLRYVAQYRATEGFAEQPHPGAGGT